MSETLTLARPYARAAFALASEASTLPAWSEMLEFAAQLAGDPKGSAMLMHPALSAQDAAALLAPPAAGTAHGGYTRFIGLLAENRRLALLPEIAQLFAQLRYEAERVVKARVTSAVPLPASELDAIEAGLRRRFGRDVVLDTAIDESLIGGALIDAGDIVIDGSLKGQLLQLRSALAQ